MSAPKPGELWWVRDTTEGDEFAAVVSETTRYWIDIRDGDSCDRDFATPLRRMIVLDPESADDVERVRVAIGLSPESLIPAKLLSNLAAPPEPEMPEPTALGTVVVDAGDVTWVLCDEVRGNNYPWRATGGVNHGAWEDWLGLPRPVRLATDEERGA